MKINRTVGYAILYTIPLFLLPFSEKLWDILWQDQWPSLPKLAACAIAGTISSCFGLRMYYDGSAERERQKKAALENKTPKTP